jgi:hypothetical protein
MRPVSRIEWIAMATFCAAILSPVFLHLVLPPDWVRSVFLAIISPAVVFFAGTIFCRPG